MTDPMNQPALELLGDRLEDAVGRSVAAGGVPPGHRRRGRVVLLVSMVLFVVLALGVVAVVPDDDPPAEASVRAAAQQTVDASTGRFEVTLATAGVPAVPDFEAVVTGAYDIPQDRFETTVDLSSLADGLAAQGLDLLGGDATFTLVVDGSTVYLRSSLVQSLLGADTEWVRVDLAELGVEGGVFGDAAGQMGAATLDPGTFLEMLEGFGGEVTEAGRESVRGTETTHYSGSIDLDVAYQQIPVEERAEIEQFLGSLVPGGIDLPTFPVDVWIDDLGLVRRFETRVSLAELAIPGGQSLAGEVSLRIEYFDPGQPVEIAVPAPEQAADLRDLLDSVGLGFLADIDLGALREDIEGLDPGEVDLDGIREHLEGLDLEGLEQDVEGFLGGLGGEQEPAGAAGGG